MIPSPIETLLPNRIPHRSCLRCTTFDPGTVKIHCHRSIITRRIVPSLPSASYTAFDCKTSCISYSPGKNQPLLNRLVTIENQFLVRVVGIGINSYAYRVQQRFGPSVNLVHPSVEMQFTPKLGVSMQNKLHHSNTTNPKKVPACQA